jgi:hypothetical protein
MITTYGQKISIIVGLILASFYFIYVRHSGQWLIPTDTYYYIALSDSLLKNGELLDLTNISSTPLVTYQNGVPFIYALLKTIDFDNLSAMRFVSTLNLFSWILASYPFYKLINYLGITSAWSRGILLLGFFSSSFLLNYQLTPGTDGLFNSGAIWLVYLLLSIYTYYNRLIKTKKFTLFLLVFSSFMISIVLVHFSIRILFYQGAFLISVLLCKHDEQKKLIYFSISLIFTTALCLAAPYLIFDPTMAENNAEMYNFFVLNRAEPLRIMLSNYLSVGNLFRFINGYILLVILIFFLAYSLIRGCLKNKVGIVFISVAISIFLFVNFLLPNPVMIQAGARYMISTLPLLCLLAILLRYTRPVAFALIATFSTVTIINLTTPYPQACISSFWTNLAEKQLSLPENTALFTDRSRYAYVYLNGRNYNLPLSSLTPSYHHIWLAGSAQFINSKLQLLKGLKNLTVENVSILLSDNMSQCLSALVQCDITISTTEIKMGTQYDEPQKEILED